MAESVSTLVRGLHTCLRDLRSATRNGEPPYTWVQRLDNKRDLEEQGVIDCTRKAISILSLPIS